MNSAAVLPYFSNSAIFREATAATAPATTVDITLNSAAVLPYFSNSAVIFRAATAATAPTTTVDFWIARRFQD